MNTLIDIKYIVIDIDPAKLNTKLKTATLLGFKNLLKILAIMMFMIKHAHYLCQRYLWNLQERIWLYYQSLIQR